LRAILRPAADVALGCFLFDCCCVGEVASLVGAASTGEAAVALFPFLDEVPVELELGLDVEAFLCGDCLVVGAVDGVDALRLDDDGVVLGFIWIIFLDLVGGGGKLNSSSAVVEDAADAVAAAVRFVPARAAELALFLRSGEAGDVGDCDINDPLRLFAIPLSAATGLNAAGGKANECSDMASMAWKEDSLMINSPDAAGVGGRWAGMSVQIGRDRCIRQTALHR
jgi:hypothetical protein